MQGQNSMQAMSIMKHTHMYLTCKYMNTEMDIILTFICVIIDMHSLIPTLIALQLIR